MSYTCDRCGVPISGQVIRPLITINTPEDDELIMAINQMGICQECKKQLIHRMENWMMYKPKSAEDIDMAAVLSLHRVGWTVDSIAEFEHTNREIIEEILQTRG